MTFEYFGERWDSVTKDGEEFLEFDKVKNKRSKRPDLHAFLMLDELFPGDNNIVVSAGHDEIWLEIESEQFEKLTDDQIIELNRCGVRYDESNDSLCMFV